MYSILEIFSYTNTNIQKSRNKAILMDSKKDSASSKKSRPLKETAIVTEPRTLSGSTPNSEEAVLVKPTESCVAHNPDQDFAAGQDQIP